MTTGRPADIDLDELYPDGRYLYYEGDDPTEFVKELREEFGEEETGDTVMTVHCLPFIVPPGKVAAFYEAAARRGWEFGS